MRQVLILIQAAALLVLGATAASAAVNLEWRPDYQVVHQGSTFQVGLYAVSDSGAGHPMSALDVIMLYDPDEISFQNLTPEGEPYDWLIDGFFSPSPNGINNALDDGDMFYTAWAQLGIPAIASTRGLLVTTLVFEAEAPACASILAIPVTYGSATTRVFDGTIPNYDVKGTLGRARVMVVPLGYLTSVAEAKQQPDETSFTLAGPIVTRAFASGGCFYIEDHNRVAGIRVNCAPGDIPEEGATPVVSGVIRTVQGERVIDAASVSVGPECIKQPIPRPFGMNNRAAGWLLDPQGLLVKLWGYARSVGSGGFVLDDGSPEGVRVELYGVDAPAQDTFVSVTGALGVDASGPVLRVNSAGDIRAF